MVWNATSRKMRPSPIASLCSRLRLPALRSAFQHPTLQRKDRARSHRRRHRRDTDLASEFAGTRLQGTIANERIWTLDEICLLRAEMLSCTCRCFWIVELVSCLANCPKDTIRHSSPIQDE